MKKLFVFLTLALVSFFITGCIDENTDPKASVENAISQCFKNVDLNHVESNLVFETTIGEVTLSYDSSNKDVVSNEGIVRRQQVDVTLQITVTFSVGSYKKAKVYEVTVLKQELQTISQIKKLPTEGFVITTGIVAFIVYGTEKNVPVGFYLFDETDAIYVHSSEYAETLKVGNKVEVSGEYTKYIDQNSLTSAEMAGYTGAKQIVPTSVKTDGEIYEVPTSFIEDHSIANLCSIPVSENITSNVYKVVAKVRKSVGNGFVNYYFDDLNGVNSYYAYTTANGKDLAWLEEYDGSIRECYIAIHNCKLSASGNFWRIVPIQILDEVEVTDEEYMEYSLDRLANQFIDHYDSPCSFDLVNTDEKLAGSSVCYSSNFEGVTFTNDGYTIHLEFGEEKVTMAVTISLTYNGKTLTRVVEFEAAMVKPTIETITIEEARKAAKGEKVTIEGYIVGFLYLAGTSKPAGFELIDDTSSIAVFVSTAVDTNTDITKLSIGEFVYVEGYGDLYQPREDHNHTGSIRLNNAEVLYHDWQEHELPTHAIEEVVFKDLVNNPSDNNITNMVFKTQIYVEKSSGSYVNYYIHDIHDPSLSTIVYSQNSGKNGPAEYEWLKPYAGKCVEAYVTLRIGAVSSGKFIWKAGVLQVLGEVDTPEALVGYFEKTKIEGLFDNEYADSAVIEYEVLEGSNIVLSHSSSDAVTAVQEGNLFQIHIATPTQTEDVSISLVLTYGSTETTIDIFFKIVKAEILTIEQFREKATKNGETVIVEGIVSSIVKSSGATKWNFYITDETGTIYCKTQAAVEVGDKVLIKGNMDLYYGLPQFADGSTITILSQGNAVPTSSFLKDKTLEEVAVDSKAGENALLGGIVYMDVEATVHVSASGERAYLSLGSVEIDLYNYTNAKYYAENYQELEALNGKTIVVTLVSFNWYKTQYTYVIANYVVVE